MSRAKGVGETMDQQQAGAETHRNRAGLLLALGGFITLSAGDGIVKSTAGEWPGPAVAALRYVFGAAALGVLLAIRHGRAGFVVPRMGIQFGRGASVAMATLCFYVGVQLMPLADVTAVQFVSQVRSEEHTSDLQSLMRTAFAVFCLKKNSRIQQCY